MQIVHYVTYGTYIVLYILEENQVRPTEALKDKEVQVRPTETPKDKEVYVEGLGVVDVPPVQKQEKPSTTPQPASMVAQLKSHIGFLSGGKKCICMN